jgi:geranylgeranyl pyrophosphate synthase
LRHLAVAGVGCLSERRADMRRTWESMSLAHSCAPPVHPPHPLLADQLSELELVLHEVKCAHGLGDYVMPAGKRLRPITFLLSSRSAGATRLKPLHTGGAEIRVAAAIELLHEASLVHDDLTDRSSTRRGWPTMHSVHGEERALLIGDLLLLIAVRLLVDTARSRRDLTVGRILAAAGIEMVRGELDQLDGRTGSRAVTMADYLAVVSRKTAQFFAACAESGAALAGVPPGLRSVYRRFGNSLGIAFQMADDIVDATGDCNVAGKPVRHDARNGVVTLPMIHAHRLAGDHPAIAKLAASESLARADEDAIYELLADEAVRRASLVTLEHHVAAARAQLSLLAPNRYRLGLEDLLVGICRSVRGAQPQPA